MLICISGENLPLITGRHLSFYSQHFFIVPLPCIRVTRDIPIIIKKFKPTHFINKNLQTLSEYMDVIQSRISAAVNKSLKLHSGSL